MNDVQLRQVYHSPKGITILALIFGIVPPIVIFGGVAMSPQSSAGGVLWLLGMVFFGIFVLLLFLGMPYQMTFDPGSCTFEYRWGYGPLKRTISGPYSELDKIYAQIVTGGRGSDCYEVNVMWAHVERRITLAKCSDDDSLQTRAKEIADETGLPYGGLCGDGPRNAYGSFSRNATMPTGSPAPALSRHEVTSAPPQTSGDVAAPPPAVGDEAGLNESDMWK